MSSEQPRQQIYDSTAPSTDTRDSRIGEGADDRFNSKLREAFGSTPFILTKFDKFMNWVRGNSMFMLQFGIACCSIEMMHTYAIKHDLDRFGAGVPRASPRQADVMIVPGTIVSKFGPRMKRVYDQMPEPKFVVGMGSCTISGGPFQEGYNVVKGAEEIIPIDIHVPGCPPRPEALVYGIAKLQERIRNGESTPVVVKPYELEEFGDLPKDELVQKLADDIDEEDLVMRYNWADSP
ncbi:MULTISPECIES: NADH-quinone oxidoreductase subunit B [Natrinema]|uniref:NADH-quinone oxidoreductase, B subunit n=3 Tax=Natrinema TaxID=88723 RepID=L9ZUQ3_NATA2|nr:MULTISPECIES: NADH-quinone oxidoreductase subunit B [Natrinema]AFO58964.1 NADH-quinone oxidoreductase, B subunit [Natrinema sp. J7-2]ELY77647.1 NADH-quinone oxidoreductase, B subunit [Natrinema gari JCM 14663]ELY90029.1 NADH-quinone oxidoreductase, B subunit [Natrinema altunense JCM 12890]RZH68630.1 NADH-quinone oxidoreductase subunit B [Natrinema altunense]